MARRVEWHRAGEGAMGRAAAALLLMGSACVAAWSGPAHAQYTSSFGYSFNNPVSAAANSIVWSNVNGRMVYRRILARNGYTEAQISAMSTEEMRAAILRSGRAPAEVARSADHAATKFRPAGKPVFLPQLAQALTADREQQAALLELFGRGIAGYEQEAAKSGFDHDVAGAMTFFIGASYLVHHGEEPHEDGMEMIARALQASMENREVRAIADADKQAFYELMIGLGTYLGVAYQQAREQGDRELADSLRVVATEALQGYLKMDPSRLRITAAGLQQAR